MEITTFTSDSIVFIEEAIRRFLESNSNIEIISMTSYYARFHHTIIIYKKLI